jgi:hypothetical protein
MQSQNSSVLTSEGPEAEEAWNNLYASADAIYKKMSNLQSFIFNENQVKNLISKKIQ